MARYMKKGSLGMMVEAAGGASDPGVAEIRLSPAEYSVLQKRIQAAEQARLSAEFDAERRESVAYEYTDAQIRKYKENIDIVCMSQKEAEQKLEQTAKEKNNLKEALLRQIELNSNLKRIARERANAKRGLVPKKEHSGYVVLYSAQYKQHCNKSETADVWHSVLQTPYDAGLSLEQIKDDIMAELCNRVLAPIGIRGIQRPRNNGIFRTWLIEEDGQEQEICGLYKWNFRADYRSGLWEMDLYHTKSLNVPEEYRPVKRI